MKNGRSQCTAILFLLLAVSPCFGWGGDGHKIVGTIAANHLTPDAKAAVSTLLGDKTLAEVSTWADEIRSDPSYRWANPLHYANVKPGEKGFDLKRDCPEKGCVVSAINKYAKILRDKSSSKEEKTDALKFLVHFVGDVHQPLHVSHARDKGGNDIRVEFFHNFTNLHRLWDSGLIRRTKIRWSDYAKKLDKAIMPGQLAEWKGNLSVDEWATESYKLALSHAYAIPKDGKLGQEYYDRCIPVVEEQLTMAGVRLATMLNGIFAEEAEAMPKARPKKAEAPKSAPARTG